MGIKLKIDFWLLAPVCVLLLIGLTTLSSINPLFLRNQSFSLIIAIIIFLFLTQIDYKVYKNIKIPIYILSIIMLFIVLLIGLESRGAVRWIELFGVRIQLSEIFKPILSLAFAAYIADKKRITFKTFLSMIIFLIPVAVLIYLQPDLGNALIYIGVFFLTLIIIGLPIVWFLIAVLPVILVSPFFWNMLHDYQRQRIITFLNPTNDPLGTSYNSIQALIAVGSGMFFGKGLGESTQSGLRFLPERHTDFIFATLSEGMGFTGGIIVILAFTFLLYRIYKIFGSATGLYEKTFLACGFFFFLIQFLLNIGMNIGILPVVGVTLPFVSFGGSSLVANFIFLSIISSISVSQKKSYVLEIK